MHCPCVHLVKPAADVHMDSGGSVFVASCLFGEESVTSEFLLKSFREYIVAEDREVLHTFLSDDFDPQDDNDNDNDDLLDFLYTFHCF